MLDSAAVAHLWTARARTLRAQPADTILRRKSSLRNPIPLRGGSRQPMLVVMSRGPTRRVQRLLASGAVSGQLLQAADHEADLLGHPYIGLEHVDLDRLHLAGRTTERDELRQRMRVSVARWWWRPCGPNSALRRRGRDQTKAARLSAERDERHMRPPSLLKSIGMSGCGRLRSAVRTEYARKLSGGQAFPLVTALSPKDCKSIAKASKVRILHLPPSA